MARTAKDVFLDALDIDDADERYAFVMRETEGDPKLRSAVLLLLNAHEGSPTFRPPAVTPAMPQCVREACEGDVIDRKFTLLRALGEGGFGVVWLARQTEPVIRDVALKLLRGGGLDSVVMRFESERQTLARMEHPNIARVFDAGTTDAGLPYFAMEYVDGEPITDYCAKHNVSLEKRLELLCEVCRAIQHAHQKGVIHRDLKPGNILVGVVDGRPVPKVIDFGIAKAIADEGPGYTVKPSLTLEAQVIGTPQYMSPEQATIGPKSIDTRSDVYSLGTVMYELITGSPPFDPQELRRVGLEQICQIVRERTPSKPSTRLGQEITSLEEDDSTTGRTLQASKLRRQVAGEIDWIVMKALEKEPARRYQSAESLAADISRFLHHEPVEAGPPSRLYAVKKFVRRHRLEVAATAVVALALVAVALVSTYQKQQAKAAEMAAEIARAEAVRSAVSERLAKDEARQSEQIAVQRAEDAARELSKATVMADFAETMMNGVGPSVARGRDTGILKDMLAAASKNADQRLDKLPELDVIIRGMIGRAYYDLGDYQRAIETIRPRFESMRDTDKRDNAERLSAGLVLATLYNQIGEGEKAAATFREVSDAYDRLGDETSSNAIQAKSGLAKALEHDGKNEEALILYRKTLARLVELKRDETEPAMEIRNAIATRLLAMGRTDEARQEWESLLPIEQRLFGDDHQSTVASMSNLAYVYSTMGQLDRAIEFNSKVVDVARKIYEPEHPLRLPSLTNLISVLIKATHYDDAERPLGEAMEILAKNGDAVSWRTRIAVEQQAMMLRRAQKRYDDAVAHAQAMAETYDKQFGRTSGQGLAGQSVLLGALTDAKRYTDAWKIVESFGPSAWKDINDREQLMIYHSTLAELLMAMGRADDARREVDASKSFAEMRPDGSLVVTVRLQRVMAALNAAESAEAATRPAATQPALAVH